MHYYILIKMPRTKKASTEKRKRQSKILMEKKRRTVEEIPDSNAGTRTQPYPSTSARQTRSIQTPSTSGRQPRRTQTLPCTQISQILTGLNNFENTCFINSALQCLSNLPCFHSCIQQNTNSQLVDEFVKVIKILQKSEISTFYPNSFLREFFSAYPEYVQGQQGCSYQFIQSLLSAVLSMPQYSSLYQSLACKLSTVTYCSVCNHTNRTPDYMISITVPVPSVPNCTLNDCFERFFASEVLEGENTLMCDGCKSKQIFTMLNTIEEYPDILIVHLNRFQVVCSGQVVKNKTPVNLPTDDFSFSSHGSSQTSSPNYKLIASINHFGERSHGHYTALILKNGVWYLCDDSRVELKSSLDFGNAYILLYIKVALDDPPHQLQDDIQSHPSCSVGISTELPLLQSYLKDQEQRQSKKIQKMDGKKSSKAESSRKSMAKKRKDASYRAQERIEDARRRRKQRENPAVKEKETKYRRQQREQPGVRQKEQGEDTKRHQEARAKLHDSQTADDLIEAFHNAVSQGPVLSCLVCDTIQYRHNVVALNMCPLPSCDAVTECTTSAIDGAWLCKSCQRFLKQGQYPPMSLANGMRFPYMPTRFKDTLEVEWTLASARKAFMKIYAAPRGGQRVVRGNVVNVPLDITETVQSLPRLPNDHDTIQVEIKRDLKYKNIVMSQTVRPARVRELAEFLCSQKLYRDQNITYDDQWSLNGGENEASPESNEVEHNSMTGTELLGTNPSILNSESTAYGNRKNAADRCNTLLDDDDCWSETGEEVNAGSLDTLLTDPTFLEDNERALKYVLAPGQGQRPMSIFQDQYSEELCFSNIFLGLCRCERNERKRPISYCDICISELKRTDRRAAQCIDNIFYKLKRYQMNQMLDRIQICLRKCKTGSGLNAGMLKNSANVNEFLFKDDAFRFMNTIRGSPPYFQKMQKDLFAMIRQLGAATLFLSFSAAETKWTHLLKTLAKVGDGKDLTDDQVKDMDWEEKCRLIRKEPAVCAMHFNNHVQQIMKILKHKNSPLGVMEDSFLRVEFQHRGSPHIHMVLWVQQPKILDKDPDNEVIAFVDSIITCRRPKEGPLKDLVAYQVHNHSQTCRKGKKFKCRFNFPMPPMRETTILRPLLASSTNSSDVDQQSLDLPGHSGNQQSLVPVGQRFTDVDHNTDNQQSLVPVDHSFTDVELNDLRKLKKRIYQRLKELKTGEDITIDEFLSGLDIDYGTYLNAIAYGLKQTTIYLRRTPYEIRVNGYNETLLLATRANMDIQPITSIYSCATYVSSYVAKALRGISMLLREAVEEAHADPNCTLKQQLRHIANKFLNNVEVCAQEACYLQLQLPLRQSSRSVVFINSNTKKIESNC